MKNAAKNKHSTREGAYLLSDSKVNGRQYWNLYGKNYALWYDTNNWMIGDESDIGKSRGYLYNTDSSAACPQIGNWVFTSEDSWITPNANDITFSTAGNLSCMSR